ncbi:MAG: DUF1501 domain-containing protein [Opitutales bacterium]
MLQIANGKLSQNCMGVSRRSALKAGWLGLLGLTSADLFRLRAEGKAQRNDKSVVLLWLDGGPSHMETYDPKPEAPIEYRGPWDAIETNVPGIRFSEKLPLSAKHADKMCVLRSVHHDNGDHFAAAHWMLTGRLGSTTKDKPQKFPSLGSCVSRVKGPNAKGLPAYVGLPAAESVYLYPGYQGAAYLGSAYDPFQLNMGQKYLAGASKGKIQKPPVMNNLSGELSRVGGRLGLLDDLDGIRRAVDKSGAMENMDKYNQEATDMILGDKARFAFDIEKETPDLRDRYGRGPWGHYTLMARRLVEAGVSFVTVDMPHWDTHSKIKTALEVRLPYLDLAVSGLLQDLADRSLLDDVLVVVMGEFGRTPKLNSGQAGIPIPGRDHWGQAMSVILAGGGLRMGQLIGDTNDKGEHPVERPLTPGDVLATIYHVLGIDYHRSFPDFAGRPVPLVDTGKPIKEII